jgi:hypothetical protein
MQNVFGSCSNGPSTEMWTPPRAGVTADAHAEYADDDVDLNEFRDVEQDYYAAARLQAVARGRSDRRSLAKAGEGEAKVKTQLPAKRTYGASPPRSNGMTSVHPGSPSSEYSRFPKTHERSPQHFVPDSKAQERFWGSTQASPSGVSKPGSPSSEYSRFPKKTERSPQHYIPVSKAQERFWGRPQVSLAKVAGSRLTKVEADLVSVFKNLEPEMPENLVVPNAHSSKPAGRARGVGMQWLVNEFAKQSGVPHMREALCAALAVQGAMEPPLTSPTPRRQETPSPSARRHAVSWLQQAEAEALPAMTPPLTPPLTPPPPPPPSPPQIRLA